MSKRVCGAALSFVLASSPIMAQTNVNTSSVAGSEANAGSASVSQGGNVTLNSNVPAATSTRNTVRQRLVTPPSVVAPGLSAAGIETCLGSVSGGISVMGGGGSFGTSVKDDDCNRRLYARQLWNMGFRQAATNIQCLSPEVQYAMAAAGTPCFATSPPTGAAGTGMPARRVYAPTAAGQDTTPTAAVAVQRRSEVAPNAAYTAMSHRAPEDRDIEWLMRTLQSKLDNAFAFRSEGSADPRSPTTSGKAF